MTNASFDRVSLPVVGSAADNRPDNVVADTFCIRPWRHLLFDADGSAKPCCLFTGTISKDGSPMSVYTHSLDEVWNSDEMRSIRRDMIQGRKISACERCYRDEAAGIDSTRMTDNRAWEAGCFNEERVTIDALKSAAVSGDFRASPPVSFELVLFSNVCNLKCRMCFPRFSSRIERDPIHSKWAGEWAPALPSEAWPKIKAVVQNELLRYAEQIKFLYFQGSETLLIKEIGDVLQYLVDAGVAHNIIIQLQTNATTTKAPWLKLTNQFKKVIVCVSIDGVGKYYEYIRYPAKWDSVFQNVRILSGLPNVSLSVNVTAQVYNALNLVDLFRCLDSLGLEDVGVAHLDFPSYLRFTTMPPRSRRLAADRLRLYAEQDCQPRNRKTVLDLAAVLEPVGAEFDEKLMRDFMLFTNDLDVSRGQSFGDTHDELLALISETGFEWTAETLHAGRPGGSSLLLLDAPLENRPGEGAAEGAEGEKGPGQPQEDQSYNELVRRVRRAAAKATPGGAIVLVVSGRDDDLLRLRGKRQGWHFPRDAEGNPADGKEAVARLKALRAKGAGYLLLPEPYFWWLGQYQEFRQHLDRHAKPIHSDADCIIYELSRPASRTGGCTEQRGKTGRRGPSPRRGSKLGA
jgi:MoaA/NifB/PqqE/SkfB family radical SAM enzyme